MKKTITRIVTVLLVISMLAAALAVTSLAADCRVSFSDPSVTVGNTVSVSVSVSGDVAAATIRLAYNTSMLEFISVSGGNSSGGGGSIVLDNEYSSGTGSMSFSISFKALQTGSTSVTCTSYDIVDGGGDAMNVTMGSSAITIQAAVTASSDANLSGLSINPGSLSPSFSSSTTSYSASVSNSVTSVAVSATKSDSKASVAVWGNSELSVGNNTVYIQVTAENGSTKTYTITVNRAAGTNDKKTGSEKDDEKKEEEEKTETKEPTGILEDGTVLKIVEFDDSLIPTGFKKTEITVNGTKVPAIVLNGAEIYAVYLEGDDAHPAGFYLFNTKTLAATSMTKTAMAPGESTLLLLDASEVKEIPAGYKVSKVQLEKTELTVFVPENIKKPNHYLVYAAGADGVPGLYLYDIEGKTFQRYNFAVVSDEPIAQPSEEPSAEPSQQPEPVVDEKEQTLVLFGFDTGLSIDSQKLVYVLLGTIVVLLALAVTVIILAVKLGRKDEEEEFYEEDEEDIPFTPDKRWVEKNVSPQLSEIPSQEKIQEPPVKVYQPSNGKTQEAPKDKGAFSVDDIIKEYSGDRKKW